MKHKIRKTHRERWRYRTAWTVTGQ